MNEFHLGWMIFLIAICCPLVSIATMRNENIGFLLSLLLLAAGAALSWVVIVAGLLL